MFARIGELAAADVGARPAAILDDAKAGGERRTANVLFADLSQMFRFAAEREIVSRNPLDGIEAATLPQAPRRERVLDDDELRALWRAVPKAGMSASRRQSG